MITRNEKEREYKREWYLRNKELTKERARNWYAENKERHNEFTLTWRAENKDKLDESNRRSRARNTETQRRAAASYRARKRNLFVEDIDALVVLEMDDGVCGICDKDVNPFDYHIDHIVPLALGGEHSYANVQVAHPLCNSIKGGRA